MEWQRARSGEKKNERREAICNAALRLFKEKGYEGVSFNGIAVEAGFTKSNMYRYFSSREEIFLSIFSGMMEEWAADYGHRLKALEQGADVDVFVHAWFQSFFSRPRFLDLTPLLFLSLERNSSYEQLLVFKTMAKGLLYGVSLEVGRVYPELQGEKAFTFLNISFSVTSSFWAAETPNEALLKIYQQEAFQELRPDFEKNLKTAVRVIVVGLRAEV